MKPTIRDVCKATGLSVATVSRALNGRPRVSEETRQLVRAAAKKLGYTPNALARGLQAENTATIGVVFRQMTSGFYAAVMTGIDLEAYTAGFHVLVTISKPSYPDHRSPFAMLEESRVDGVIVLDPRLDAQGLRELESFGRPVVLIQKTSKAPLVSSVRADNEGGGCQGLRHLLALGHRDILIVAGPQDAEDSDERMTGCRRALAEAGLSLKPENVIRGHYSAAEAREAFQRFCRERQRPRAVFAFNDDMAMAVMQELRRAGARVPQDVAVVGFDGVEAAEFMGLTTVEIPMNEIGHEAVRLLVRHIREPGAPAEHIVKETRLVVRESTQPAE